MKFFENSEHSLRPLSLDVQGLSPVGLAVGGGNLGLEIAVLSSQSKPATTTLQRAFKDRKGSRASPVLIVVTYQEGHIVRYGWRPAACLSCTRHLTGRALV